ncbi:MAG: type I-E CRISPR-associated protein Cas7/Cse4/CasC, partial [Caldisericales bacterium]|nr:type I-E CRISPR-associated protein Cas7/Cse4/CasC [Caldisericales bacterium]
IHYDDAEIKMLVNLFSKVLSGEKKPEEAAKEFKPKSKASDIALFGRMVAENTDFNVDAACQVAHAISTNKVSMEMDYFTAIDDLKKDFASEDAGAGMIGTVEFNSACFYRYSVVDTNQLKANLDGDNELSKKTVRAFIESSIAAIPTGKQNSMAAQNPPSFVMAVVKDSCAPWSLANAFEKPVGPGQNGLVVSSIERFDDYWGRLVSVYSNDGVKTAVLFTTENVDLKNLASSRVSGKKELVEKIIGAIY